MPTLPRCVRALLALSALVPAAACATRSSAERPAPNAAHAFADRADALACSRDVLYPLGFSSEGERSGTADDFGSRLRDDTVAIVAVRRDASDAAAPRRDELSVVARRAGDGRVAVYATAISMVGAANTVTPLSAEASRALHLLFERCGAVRRQGLGG